MLASKIATLDDERLSQSIERLKEKLFRMNAETSRDLALGGWDLTLVPAFEALNTRRVVSVDDSGIDQWLDRCYWRYESEAKKDQSLGRSYYALLDLFLLSALEAGRGHADISGLYMECAMRARTEGMKEGGRLEELSLSMLTSITNLGKHAELSGAYSFSEKLWAWRLELLSSLETSSTGLASSEVLSREDIQLLVKQYKNGDDTWAEARTQRHELFESVSRTTQTFAADAKTAESWIGQLNQLRAISKEDKRFEFVIRPSLWLLCGYAIQQCRLNPEWDVADMCEQGAIEIAVSDLDDAISNNFRDFAFFESDDRLRVILNLPEVQVLVQKSRDKERLRIERIRRDYSSPQLQDERK